MALRTKENDSFVLHAGKIKIEHSTEVTLFGAKVDKQLKHKIHIEELCRRPLIKFMFCVRLESIQQLKRLANSFINSQSTYASLMFLFTRSSDVS